MIALCQNGIQTAMGQNFALVLEPSELISQSRTGQSLHGDASEAMKLKFDPNETIVVPQEARGRLLSDFSVSVRLAHVFEWKKFRLLGELHGLTYGEIGKYRNCGRRTVQELCELIRSVQCGEPSISLVFDKTSRISPDINNHIFIPPYARDFSLLDLPISVRLANALECKGVVRLGDLEGHGLREFKRLANCGTRTLGELKNLINRITAGEFQPASSNFSPASTSDLIRMIDNALIKLPTRGREILILRLGGEANRCLTLEEIGQKFKLTRERIRQIAKKALDQIRKIVGPQLSTYLRGVAAICSEKVCPLSPTLLTKWLGKNPAKLRFVPVTYVRLLGELDPGIPVWLRGQEPSSASDRDTDISDVAEKVLRDGQHTLPLGDALQRVRTRIGKNKPNAVEFLEALKHSRTLTVDFANPDEGVVRLRRLIISDVTKAILLPSACPLTPEDILAKAQEKFGDEIVRWDVQTARNSLVPEKGFFLLGPRCYGLRQHFRLPERLWNGVRRDVQSLLKTENRPISTSDLVAAYHFDWASQTNKYELAYVLREDERFVDLGRLLFGLTEWGIEERSYIKDLIPKILAEAGRPMTSSQVLEHLHRLRSFSPQGISSNLRNHPQVRDYGFGHFGLKSWGDSVQVNIVTDSVLVERVIRRAEPPLRFARLCEILNLPPEGNLVDKLWQTCAALLGILRLPDESTGTTRLIHKTCRLERALVATAREVNRPLPLYEFQWELNERFGSLFANKSSDDLRRCLEQSPMFLRDADDEFILDIHLEQLGLDAAAIRGACFELLSQTNEIIGCEDLLERLEADGKSWEELSADILASLLRDDATFQEVGRDRFRVKVCKH